MNGLASRSVATGCLSAVCVILAVALLATACAGAPGRKTEVDRLATAIRAMPGVESYSASYANDITHGSVLDLTVTMPHASEAQISDVATRINDIKQRDFEKYSQTAEFVVGERITVKRAAELDPAAIAADARRLRLVGAALPGARVSWFHTSAASYVDIRSAPNTADAVAAVRTELATEPLQLTVAETGAEPLWTVDFPFDAAREQRIRQQLSGLPIQVTAVDIRNGHLWNLAAGVRAPKSAYEDLTATITAVRPTRDHPMYLRWAWNGGDRSGPQFSGLVHVAGCDYGSNTAGEQNPERYYTPEAVALQRRLRIEFDACR
ncbi:hypothetical protein [Nocardia sp. NPDC050710]|uniref:hypothetical protein n=1 Tax=Nocardia sp. NPDC050710 TaxID=3157220 RepID=UPI003407FCC5